MPKPSKPKTPTKTSGEQIAIISGHISGIPDSLAKAVANLRDVERRCEATRAVAGILSERQAAEIACVQTNVHGIIGQLDSMQRETHQMHMDGIGLPKVAPEMELV